MNYLYGGMTILIGIFFLVSAIFESEFVVYRIFVARSKMMWKDNVHTFYKVVGVLLIIVGILFIILRIGV